MLKLFYTFEGHFLYCSVYGFIVLVIKIVILAFSAGNAKKSKQCTHKIIYVIAACLAEIPLLLCPTLNFLYYIFFRTAILS